MNGLLSRYDQATQSIRGIAFELLPLLARLVFASVLAGYFWASASTKLDGILTPSAGAYAQIFPRAFEAAGYDSSALGLWRWFVVLAGSYAEFVLPALLILGAFTRLAALGMIGFIIVQSLTDIIGHGADAAAIGTLFDRIPDAPILDQRALWMLLLAVLLACGAGRLSLDALLLRIRPRRPEPAQTVR